jgi:cytochrome c556
VAEQIEVSHIQVRQVAALVAVPSHLSHFTEAVRATKADPSIWGDQQDLVTAANRWQTAFQQASTVFTDGLTSTHDLLEEAASAYRAHDALTATHYNDLFRRLEHKSGPWR